MPLRSLPPLLAAALLAFAGCDDGSPEADLPGEATSAAVISEGDHDHGHKHVHSESVGHDHDHDDFEGSHSHDHHHPHRHGDDDSIVSIGHTHHGAGVTDFHGRVLRPKAGRLTLELLANDGDDLKPFADGPDGFEAIVGSDSNAGVASRKLAFKRDDETNAYAADLDAAGQADRPRDGETVLVVVPTIKLDGERLDFSFPLPTAGAADDVGDTEDAGDETDGSDAGDASTGEAE